MKNNAIIRIVIYSIVIVALLGIMCAVMFGSHVNRGNGVQHIAQPVPLTTSPTEDPSVSGEILEEVTIYASPSTDGTSLGTLQPGERITIERQENVSGKNWVYITAPEYGWILMDHVEERADSTLAVSSAVAVNVRVTKDAKLYSAPSTEAELVAVLHSGVEVVVKKQEMINGADWSFITSPEQGWILSETLETIPAETTEVLTGTDELDGTNTFAAGDISELEIEWVAGDILIQTGNSDRIIMEEDNVSNTKYEMRLKQKGQKLSILFCEEDISSFFGINIGSDLSKDLTITVPKDWICDSLEIECASAAVKVRGVTVREVEFDGASGTCEFDNCSVDKLDVDTASGDIRFSGTLDILECDAASASVYAVLSNTPSRIAMDSMSGDLDLMLPADTGFTVTMDGMNKHFTSDFQTTSKNGSYVYGDGSCRISLDAMSGDVVIRKGETTAAPDATAAP